MSDDKRFTLRIDPELFEKLKSLAEKHKRSIAKEIEYLLEKQLTNDESDKRI